ncbi:transcriptional regulator with XRE-family HTH domain [Actinokineospora baliensis]|uniref:helix-turn-helix domain-containing protein n=1 Tax=Actinokineospora baliensis TaxID=547056 RepID=UPI00195CBB81|nr:helix-turn-helix transcriptional regulator [Actinokineospora baliensis]MBM7776585.1 transcriptional regulator with XRE-family HTH domain [Actinokineospora baliensis]
MARTPKGVALGNVLRRTREASDLTLREVAKSLDRDAPTLSRYENGNRTPRPELVSRMFATYGVDGARHDELMTLAYRLDDPQWFAATEIERQQQAAAYVECERSASGIVQVSPLVLPELLQTPAVLRSIPRSDHEVETTLRRQEVLTGDRPTRYTALIGVSALHQHIGGKEAAVEQLDYLVAMTRRPHIELRITPAGLGWHPGLDGPFTVIDSKRIGPVVFVATKTSTLWLHRPVDVGIYQEAVGFIRDVSFAPDDSARIIEGLATRLREGL